MDGEELEELVEVKEGKWKETVREPFKPLMDPQVVLPCDCIAHDDNDDDDDERRPSILM